MASQKDQLSYIPYPRLTQRQDPWVTVTQINPRGRVHRVIENDPLQQICVGNVGFVDQSLVYTNLVQLGEEIDDILDVS